MKIDKDQFNEYELGRNDVLSDLVSLLYPEECKQKDQNPLQVTKDVNISNLRQWLNENRITDPKKMVTNEEIETWLIPPEETEEKHNNKN